MLIDVTGTPLFPGNHGENCPGNGLHMDENGLPIECCCDECSYALCCLEDAQNHCDSCTDPFCPLARMAKESEAFLKA